MVRHDRICLCEVDQADHKPHHKQEVHFIFGHYEPQRQREDEDEIVDVEDGEVEVVEKLKDLGEEIPPQAQVWSDLAELDDRHVAEVEEVEGVVAQPVADAKQGGQGEGKNEAHLQGLLEPDAQVDVVADGYQQVPRVVGQVRGYGQQHNRRLEVILHQGAHHGDHHHVVDDGGGLRKGCEQRERVEHVAARQLECREALFPVQEPVDLDELQTDEQVRRGKEQVCADVVFDLRLLQHVEKPEQDRRVVHNFPPCVRVQAVRQQKDPFIQRSVRVHRC